MFNSTTFPRRRQVNEKRRRKEIAFFEKCYIDLNIQKADSS